LPLVGYIGKHQVSKQERDSISHFIDKVALVNALLNDLYSFPKEFEKHYKLGTLDQMDNSIAFLMSNYGYNENEAMSILKDEIRVLEHVALEEFQAWQLSDASNSSDLRRYAISVIVAEGGTAHWMANSERYFRTDLTTTAKTRAMLVKTSRGLEKLENHPPPAACSMNGHTAAVQGQESAHINGTNGTNGTLTDEADATPQQAVSGDEASSTSEINILQPFRKAPSEKVSYPL
jgi:hypothetical protein